MGDPIPAPEPEPIPLPHEPPTQFRARTKYLRKGATAGSIAG